MTEGSSPRVRGMLTAYARGNSSNGIIPACAGNAPELSGPPACGPDHPRVCGECSQALPRLAPSKGSSPRVRGMHLVGCDVRDAGRIIPACAGNAHPGGDAADPGADHPRVCGECSPCPPAKTLVTGSSPRVRGMLVHRERERRHAGIIPACAGNAVSGSPTASARADHPRVCGECDAGRDREGAVTGSSPRVRGMRTHCHRCQVRRSDHPRVCGECPPPVVAAGTVVGSSPRVRGMPPDSRYGVVVAGIIPACAGNAMR